MRKQYITRAHSRFPDNDSGLGEGGLGEKLENWIGGPIHESPKRSHGMEILPLNNGTLLRVRSLKGTRILRALLAFNFVYRIIVLTLWED